MTFFSLSEDAKGKSLSIFFDNGDSETIPESHVSFKAILQKWLENNVVDEEIRELVNVLQTVATKMSALSERVSATGKEIYFDGDVLRGELSSHIKEAFSEGRSLDFKPLVNFLEKAKTNPSLESVDALYRWIKQGDLVIDPDGDIIAYKGTRLDANGVPHSVSRGTAFVNGEEVEGNIPNVAGTVITMPRSEVNGDGKVACSTGLHAGTHSYASSFAPHLILVKINPRDVVSVPEDSSSQKLRVSRYVVLHEVKDRLESKYYQPALPLEEPKTEDTVKETTTVGTSPIRDSKGRFIKGGNAPRDSKGRFI